MLFTGHLLTYICFWPKLRQSRQSSMCVRKCVACTCKCYHQVAVPLQQCERHFAWRHLGAGEVAQKCSARIGTSLFPSLATTRRQPQGLRDLVKSLNQLFVPYCLFHIHKTMKSRFRRCEVVWFACLLPLVTAAKCNPLWLQHMAVHVSLFLTHKLRFLRCHNFGKKNTSTYAVTVLCNVCIDMC